MIRSFDPEVTIHPTAVVGAAAELGADVTIGPYAVIESGARIGHRTRVGASAYVSSACDIGPDCEIQVGAVLGGTAQVRGLEGNGGRVHIGARTIIREHVTIHRARQEGDRTVIGADNFLLAGCHVAHDCRIGDRVTIANGVLLAGYVTIGDAAFVSGNAAVHQYVQVGSLAMIAGQARVSKDVPPFAMVVGDSEVCGLNVVGMRRAGMSAVERANAKRVYAVVYRSRLNVSQAAARLRTLPASDEVNAWLAFIDASTRGLCPARRLRK
jgi:UDP-N-acetylglucosamine acyltransferase